MQIERTGTARIVLSWLGVFLFRLLLLPVRAPNVEPMMAVVMPVSKRAGLLTSVLFASSGIVLYDAVTAGLGIWTAVTALAYGAAAAGAYAYFRNREPTRMNFVVYGVGATLCYDALTGLTVGPLAFGQSFSAALAGQIPFTILHLLGTVVFALFLSPAVMRFLSGAPVPSAAGLSTAPRA